MNTRTNTNPATLFYSAGLGLRLLRAALALLQRLAPRLGAALAFQLFSTPLPLKWLQRKRLPAPWRAQPWSMMGMRLCAWRHGEAQSQSQPTPRRRILLVHGWAGQARQMHAAAETLWAAGFDPILLDLPAHGHSQGLRSHMPQFLQTLNAAAQHFGPFHGVLAHSLGALAVGHAVARGLPAQRLALLACSAPPRLVLDWFCRSFGLGPSVQQQIGARLVKLGGVPLETFEPAWLGQHLKAAVLLVHDRRDKAAPLSQAQTLHAALPNASLHVTEGLGHVRLLGDPGVLARVSAHFAD